MRKFMDILSQKQTLNEAGETKTKTDKKFSFMPDLEAETGTKSVAKATPKGPRVSSKAKEKPDAKPSGFKQAGGKKTRAAAAGATMSHPGAAEAFRQMMAAGGQDEISDAQARRNAGHDEPDMLGHDVDTTHMLGHDREPGTDLALNREVPTNDNLPALVNKEIELSGNGGLIPEWHQIKHLPGYMQNAIRAGGRSVFRQFTDTPIEDIQMICTIQGMNPESDVKGVMNWIRRNGVPEQEAKMTFGGGIEADVRLWKTEDFSFLIVKDFMGIYVYGWVGEGRGVHIGDAGTKRISRA